MSRATDWLYWLTARMGWPGLSGVILLLGAASIHQWVLPDMAVRTQALAVEVAALEAQRVRQIEEPRRVDALDRLPDPRAPSGLAAVEMVRRNDALVREAEEAMGREEYEAARLRLRAVLTQAPADARAAALLKQVNEKVGRPQGVQTRQLARDHRCTVTLEFRDAPIRSVFDALSRQSGINFVFDKDVRTDVKTTVYARNTSIADAIDMILATSQLARKVLNANTLLVYPNQPAKLREYEELVVRAFSSPTWRPRAR